MHHLAAGVQVEHLAGHGGLFLVLHVLKISERGNGSHVVRVTPPSPRIRGLQRANKCLCKSLAFARCSAMRCSGSCCPSSARASAFARAWLLRRSWRSCWSLMARKPANVTLGFGFMGNVCGSGFGIEGSFVSKECSMCRVQGIQACVNAGWYKRLIQSD